LKYPITLALGIGDFLSVEHGIAMLRDDTGIVLLLNDTL
jgi:hypothetical protein